MRYEWRGLAAESPTHRGTPILFLSHIKLISVNHILAHLQIVSRYELLVTVHTGNSAAIY